MCAGLSFAPPNGTWAFVIDFGKVQGWGGFGGVLVANDHA